MYLKKINFWFLSSLLVSIFVAIPIVTVFTSFFEDTSNYYQILKDTFLLEYIFNSLILLISVLFLTFLTPPALMTWLVFAYSITLRPIMTAQVATQHRSPNS